MTAEDLRPEENHATAYRPEHPAADEPAQEAPESAEQAQRRRLQIIGLVLIVVAGLLVLLATQCTGTGLTADLGVGRTIGEVGGERPLPGSISIWVKSGTDVEALARAARVRVVSVTDMGSGRYVLAVHEGDEAAAVAALKGLEGVWDAGYVYPDREAAETPTP